MTTQATLSFSENIARVKFTSDLGIQVISAELREQLRGILDDLEGTTEGRVVIFEADGRTFFAGADLNELMSLDADRAEAFAHEGQQLMNRISRLPQPTIAAVHAACAGGGCELALACDFRIGAETASIGLPETSIGVIPGWGGTVRTTRMLGAAKARYIILSAELWLAEEAWRIGLLDHVIEDDSFRAAVDEFAEDLLRNGPNAIAAAKQLIDEFTPGDLEEMLAAEARAFAECYKTGEPNEGMSAFLEKRDPGW